MNTRPSRRTLWALVLGLSVIVVALGLIGIWGYYAAVAHALGATRYVAASGTDGSNDCTHSGNPCQTVQHAVDQAGTEDEIHVAAGTYSGVNDQGGHDQVVYLAKTVWLRGGYNAGFSAWDPDSFTTTLDAGGQGRVLYITGEVSPTIEGFHITGGLVSGWGESGGGVYVETASAEIRGNAVSGNTAYRGGGLALYQSDAVVSGNVIAGNAATSYYRTGGGLYLYYSDATLSDNTITENSAERDGGGLYLYASNVRMTGNTIVGNTAGSSDDGGGLLMIGGDDSLLSQNTIRDNAAGWNGGGMSLSNSEATLSNNTVISNTAGNDGGGIHLENSSNAMLAGNTISLNQAGYFGGGVFVDASGPSLIGNSISGNQAISGGGLDLLNGSGTTLTGNTFYSNTATQYGGGLSGSDLNLRLNGNTFRDNTAGKDGGGLYLWCDGALGTNTIVGNAAQDGGGVYLGGGGRVALAGNTIVSNTADEHGGGLHVYRGVAVLNGDKVIHNTAGGDGGGLYLVNSSKGKLINTVLADNQVSGAGSGVYVAESELQLLHATIARNGGGDGSGIHAVDDDFWTYTHVAVINTILAEQAVGITATGGSEVTVDGVLWFSNGADTGGAGDIVVANAHTGGPDFVDPDGGDYHIQSTSMAKDNGVAADILLDVDGDYRPHAEPADLGADEIVAAPPAECRARLNDGAIYGTLQQAIAVSASPADVIKVSGACTPTVSWTGWPYVGVVTKTLTLRGGYNSDFSVHNPDTYPTFLNGILRGGVLALDGAISPTVEHLTLLGGIAGEGGGIRSSAAGAVLNELVVVNNSAGAGGGVWLNGVDGRLESSRVAFNWAAGSGGGIYSWESDTAIVSDTLQGNTSGSAGGGAYLIEGGATTVSRNQITDNVAGASGGGLGIDNSNGLSASDNVIRGNTSNKEGGGILLQYSDATLSGNTIQGNTSSYSEGGGVAVLGDSTFALDGNTVVSNTSLRDGGGVYLYSSAATLVSNTITRNAAQGKSDYAVEAYGGGVYVGASDATLVDNIISDNSAADGGGGVCLSGSDGATVSSNTISGNEVWFPGSEGGGIYLAGSDAAVSGNSVVSNTADYGGGLHLDGSAALVSRNAVAANVATEEGGGIYLMSSDGAILNANQILRNSADSGGGLYLYTSDALLSSNTVIGNAAEAKGGGVYVHRSNPQLVNDVVADNRAANTGSGVYAAGSNLGLLHNTIARNGDGDGSGLYLTEASGTDSTASLVNTILEEQAIGIWAAADSETTVDGVLWFSNGANAGGGGSFLVTNAYTGTPAFVDPDDGDYHIQPTSMAKDHGVDTGYPLDIDGDIRLLAAPPDLGADEIVTTPAGACRTQLNDGLIYHTLQEAIAASTSPGDLVKVSGTCTPTARWNGWSYVGVVTKTLTVRGGYNSDFSVHDPQTYPTYLNGNLQGGVVMVDGVGAASALTPTVEHLTLMAGLASHGGGVHVRSAGLVLDSVTAVYNQAAATGGGIYVEEGSLVASNSTIRSNTAKRGGGMASAGGDKVQVSGCAFSDNSAGEHGAGLYLSSSDGVQISGSTIVSNTAGLYGGGLYLNRSHGTTLLDDEISYNLARQNSGGGVSLNGSDNVSLVDNTIRANAAGYVGGGLYATSSDDLTLSGNTFADNESDDGGGGLYVADSDRVAMTENVVTGNTVEGGGLGGGGMNLSNGTAQLIQNNEFSQNAARGLGAQGGGVNLSYVEATLAGNVIVSNTAEGPGGGLYLDTSDATLVGNTVGGNAASRDGGGVYAEIGKATLSDNDMVSNTARSGGGLYLYYGNATLNGNRIRDNRASVSGGGLYANSNDPVSNGNLIRNNAALTYGGGLYLDHWSDAWSTNDVFVGNQAGVAGSGLYAYGSSPRLAHATLHDNIGGDVSGLHVARYSSYYNTVWLTNTIVVSQAVGITAALNCTVHVNGVLWSGNGANTGGAGSIEVTNQHSGIPAFYSDGYHLTGGSQAIDQGVSSGVHIDVDGQYRPFGAAPDLGADEYGAPAVLKSVTIAGPATGQVSVSYTFSATASPDDAATPITYTWEATGEDDVVHAGGGVSDTAQFTWDTSGAKTIVVTAEHAYGAVNDVHVVVIEEQPACTALTSVTIAGPTTGVTGTAVFLTATVSPADATTPIGYTWEATGQDEVVHAGGGTSDAVQFTWEVSGTKMVTVTAVNQCSSAGNSRTIAISLEGWPVYLPLVMRGR